MSTIKVIFNKSMGDGQLQELTVDEQTTVGAVFAAQLGLDVDPAQYVLRLNGRRVATDQPLQDGDEIQVTPLSVKGGK